MSRLPAKTPYLLLKSTVYGLYGSKVDCYAFPKASHVYRSSLMMLTVCGPEQSPDHFTQRFIITRQFMDLPSIDFVVKLYDFLNTCRISTTEPNYIDLSIKFVYHDTSHNYDLNLEESHLSISCHEFTPDEIPLGNGFGKRWFSRFSIKSEPLHMFRVTRRISYGTDASRDYSYTQAAVFTASQMNNLLRMLKYATYSVLADRTVR